MMPEGTKKLVWMPSSSPPSSARSKSIMNPAAVSTGRAKACRMAVMNMLQIVRGMRNSVMPGARMLMMVVM